VPSFGTALASEMDILAVVDSHLAVVADIEAVGKVAAAAGSNSSEVGPFDSDVVDEIGLYVGPLGRSNEGFDLGGLTLEVA